MEKKTLKQEPAQTTETPAEKKKPVKKAAAKPTAKKAAAPKKAVKAAPKAAKIAPAKRTVKKAAPVAAEVPETTVAPTVEEAVPAAAPPVSVVERPVLAEEPIAPVTIGSTEEVPVEIPVVPAVEAPEPGPQALPRVLYVTSEAAPFCKTGGLADVAGSLPPALAAAGQQVAVILPLYQRVRDAFGHALKFVRWAYVHLGWRSLYCGLYSLERQGVLWYFVDNEQYFKRPELYGYYDDGERFAFFSRCVVELLPALAFMPEVIHCNDWQTALVPVYLKDDGVRQEELRSIRTVMTVHNIEYQGVYGKETLGDLFALNQGWWSDGSIAMNGDVNLLKGALLMADAVTAVSPTYAQELKQRYFAHGLDSVLRHCEGKLHGVLNGIDMERYDPAQDSLIAAVFDAAHMAGKAVDKAALQERMGLPQRSDVALIGMVSRLVSHKGLDLVCEVLEQLLELPVQLVVLGKGDQRFEEYFRWAQREHPDQVGLFLGYDEGLAMEVYAGADLFLMPSKSEPCGLSQMIAMRYGTVPIVRETGGLRDTVQPYEAWRDAGNGFTFSDYLSADMLFVIRQAVELYTEEPEAFVRLRKRGMGGDFSWKRSAEQYCHIYETILGRAQL